MSERSLEAIIVGRQDLGESDRIVHLLTQAHGRLDVVARGARRSRKRFGGAIEMGTRVVAAVRSGRGSLQTLTGVDVLSLPMRAREDYDRLLLLGYGCEVLSMLSERELEEVRGYRLLEVWLELLEGEGMPDAASRVAFEAKALTFAGLAPALVRCPVCGESLEGTVRFDLDAGGGVHAWCGRGDEIDAGALAVVEQLRRTPLSDTPGWGVPPEVRWLLAGFIEHHTGRGIRSRTLFGASPS